jgi:hypothetical protein
MNWIKKVLSPALLTILVMIVIPSILDPGGNYHLDKKFWGVISGSFVIILLAGSIHYRRTGGKEGFRPIKNLLIELGIQKEDMR